MDWKTHDIVMDNIQALKQLFPEAFSEDKVDFESLKLLLWENISNDKEKYSFSWKGKNDAIKLALSQNTGTLRPDFESSKNWDETQNIYIEWDNLEVLRTLQDSYRSEVKMIYIDPPYNTWKDFVYKDDFHDNVSSYREKMGENMKSNPETNGRYHTDWLNMMYPRLKLARNLLKDDGVIFISIDDNEVFNLKKICDEIYWEDNFVNIISAKMKNVAWASGWWEDKRLKKNVEYILVYVKSYEVFESFNAIYNRTEISEMLDYYNENNISWKYTAVLVYDGDKKFVWSAIDWDWNDIKIYSRNNFIIKSIGQIIKDEWLTVSEVYSKYYNRIFRTTIPQSSIRVRVMEKVQELWINNEFYSIEYVPKSWKNKWQIYEQFYKWDKFNLFAWFSDVWEKDWEVVYKLDKLWTLWDKIDLNNLTKEWDIKFENWKKPIKLLKSIINMCSIWDDLILDFFSGSSSTAHACMEQNLEDWKKRKFIMVQIPELIDKNEEHYWEWFRTICEIWKARIRRAWEKILEENKDKEWIENLDVWFKVFKLDTTNLKKWETSVEWDTEVEIQKELQMRLQDMTNSVKEDRNQIDMVYEVMLKNWMDLTLPIQELIINWKKVFSVDNNHLIACLEDNVDIETVKEISNLSPNIVVFYDNSFKDDVVKVNAIQNLEKWEVQVRVI